MCMITTRFTRELQRCTGYLCMHFLLIFQEVRPVSKTCNQLFILAGQMGIGIGDGTTRRFGPGDVVLADDRTGKGHTTRSLGVPRVSATVAVAA